jgi:hypothetical protein
LLRLVSVLALGAVILTERLHKVKKKTKKKSFQNKMQFINFVELKQPVRRLPDIRVFARVHHAQRKQLFTNKFKYLVLKKYIILQLLSVSSSFLCNKITLFYAGAN